MGNSDVKTAVSVIGGADFINGMLLRPVLHEVPDLGWIKVRGLSVLEIEELRGKHPNGGIGMMVAGIEFGLVEPTPTAEIIDAIRNGNPGHVNNISQRILELSGQGEGNKKESDPLPGGGS